MPESKRRKKAMSDVLALILAGGKGKLFQQCAVVWVLPFTFHGKHRIIYFPPPDRVNLFAPGTEMR